MQELCTIARDTVFMKNIILPRINVVSIVKIVFERYMSRFDHFRESPESPVVRTPQFQYRVHKFDPWMEN